MSYINTNTSDEPDNNQDFNFTSGTGNKSYKPNVRFPKIGNNNLFNSSPDNRLMKINMGGINKQYLKMGDRNRQHALNIISSVNKI